MIQALTQENKKINPSEVIFKVSEQLSMGGRAEGLECADPGARTPIGMSGIIL